MAYSALRSRSYSGPATYRSQTRGPGHTDGLDPLISGSESMLGEQPVCRQVGRGKGSRGNVRLVTLLSVRLADLPAKRRDQAKKAKIDERNQK